MDATPHTENTEQPEATENPGVVLRRIRLQPGDHLLVEVLPRPLSNAEAVEVVNAFLANIPPEAIEHAGMENTAVLVACGKLLAGTVDVELNDEQPIDTANADPEEGDDPDDDPDGGPLITLAMPVDEAGKAA